MPGRIRNLIFYTLLCSALLCLSSPGLAYVPGKPHDFSLNNPKGHCLNCHDPHQPNNPGTGYAYVLKRPNEIAVCYQCHAGSQNNYSTIDPTLPLSSVSSVESPYDIRSEFNNNPADSHFPDFPYMDGEVNKCSECHNPHGIFNSNSTTKYPMLLSAGPDAVKGTYEFCLVCHNSDANPPYPKFSNISVPARFKFSRTAFLKMRHSTFGRPTSSAYPRSMVMETGTYGIGLYDTNPYALYNTGPYNIANDIPCLTCHNPHGSSNQYMLKRPNDVNFCLYCHDTPVSGLRSFTSYRNGEHAPSLTSFTTSGHGMASLNTGTYGRRIMCQDCHFPHGTGQKNAIYTTITDPHTGSVNHDNIALNGMNSMCFACHGSRSTSGYYPGPTAYNSSIHKTSANALNPNDIDGEAPGDCANCHNPHGTPGNYPEMTVGNKQDLCFQCHNSTTPNTADMRNISALFQMNSHHDLTQVTCTNCHNVHTVTPSSVMANPFYPVSTITDNRSFCLKCHSGTTPTGVGSAPNISAQWVVGHGRNNILECSDCHTSHGSTNSKDLNYKTLIYGNTSATFGYKGFLDFTGSACRSLCQSCHKYAAPGYKGASSIPTGAGYVSQHNPTDTTPCSHCHTEAHNPLLWNYTGASAYFNTYCLNCHELGTGNPYPEVKNQFFNVTYVSHHALTYNPPTTVDCTKCHGTHANISASYDVTDPNPDIMPSQVSSTDIALTATATASGSCCKGNNPQYAINGDGNSTWWDGNSLPAWIEVDLGSSQVIGRVAWTGLDPNPENNSTGNLPTSYQIQYSNDNSTWITIENITGNSSFSNTFTFTPVIARYVRMYITAVATSGWGPSVGEFYIYPLVGLNPNTSNAFCLKCHNSINPVSIGGQTPPDILSTYTAAGHGMASLSRTVYCTECHEHHGSVNKHLIKQTINGSPVSSNYSGINISICLACHKSTDPNLAYWPGYSVFSSSVHSYGDYTTGNLVTDGQHGPGVCLNCHNPHGSRVNGVLTPYMNNKEGENLCFSCHASGYDNFSTPNLDYNNKWDHFGTFLKIAEQADTSNGRLAGLHFGQSGGQSIPQNTSVWDGLISSNAFPDNDAVITVSMKIPEYVFNAGGLTAGLGIEDAEASAADQSGFTTNYVTVFYRMHSSPPAWICRYYGDSGPVGPNAFGDEATNYHTIKIVRHKAFGTFSSYIDNTLIEGGTFNTHGYFRVRLFAAANGNTNATPESLETWFRNFNVTYTSGGSAHNTASGDDVQARFYMKTHHKVADYDQTDGSKVECTDCHDPHTITQSKMGYVNITSNGKIIGVQPVPADQNFCLKCHDGNPPPGVAFPPNTSVASSIVWDKSLFVDSAHGNPLNRYTTIPGEPGVRDPNYNNGVTYACKVCHNPHGSNQPYMQRDSWDINRDGIPDDINGDGILDSATQVGYIGYSTNQSGNVVMPRRVILVNTMTDSNGQVIPSRATFKRISTTIPYQANGIIGVMLCLNCHDGKPAPDVKSEFMKRSHHDVTFADQTAHGGSLIECWNCHDQHRAEARNDALGGDHYPTTNPIYNPPGPLYNPAFPPGDREPMPGDAAFCLKCHDTNGGNPPPGVSGVSFGDLKLKNIKLSYNPNNYVDPVTGYDIITSNGQGHFARETGKPIMCRTCHNQHGSNYTKMLRDDTIPGTPNYDSSQPIQNMRPVALGLTDPYGGGNGLPISSTAERCLSCHSGGTTYTLTNGTTVLIPIPPPPNALYLGFSSLPSVGRHPDIVSGVNIGNGLEDIKGQLYSKTFVVSTSLGSVKDVCTLCHDSHNPYIPTVDGELMDCYKCHNANTALPDVQTEFDANPLNPNRSKSYHPIEYNPSSPVGVECRKCHDMAKHMQGRVRLRKDPLNCTEVRDGQTVFADTTSDADVWTCATTTGGFVSDSTKPFTNGSTISTFCLECHGASSTVAATFNGTDVNGVTGVHNPPRLPFGIMSGAHFTNGKLVCTNCHEYHGSVNSSLKRNSFITKLEPTPPTETQSLEGANFCYGCHNNPANSKDGVNIEFKFMSTISHHKVGAAEQAASGAKIDCTNCHNPHIATRTQPVVYGNQSTTLANPSDPAFCISCHSSSGAPGVQFPGFANGSSGPEWNPTTGAWNRWNKQAFTNSTSSAHFNAGIKCINCHDPHGSSNYDLLLTNISSSAGVARNIKVSFGLHSTIRGKRTEEIGVNSVCAACHQDAMQDSKGAYEGYSTYPGYGSFTSLTFGRKTGVDKNCTYCHNPHSTMQWKRFQNDTTSQARFMMRANKPLDMNMTSVNYGNIYNFKGFNNSSTGAPYYEFCSSRGCHVSYDQKTKSNTFITPTESGKSLYDPFNMDLPVDTYNGYATASSHHPIKEGIITCTSCHKEHGTSTKATDYLAPDLRATYYRAINWPMLWHGGVGMYQYNNSTLTLVSGGKPHQNGRGDGAYWGSSVGEYDFFGGSGVQTTNRNEVTNGFENTTTPDGANNLCFMCHHKSDIIGNYTSDMKWTNTKFLGHEAVKGGAKMTHQISPLTPIPANGEYHDYSCSMCHFPHATSQNKLLKVSCFSHADNESLESVGRYNNSWSGIGNCHAYTKWGGGSTYRGWRNLTTSTKTDFARPHNTVDDLRIASVNSNLSVTLNWTAIADTQTGQACDHYNVYRYTSYITQAQMPYATRVSEWQYRGLVGKGSAIGSQVTYTDNFWIQPGATYYYVVVACDADNDESFVSNCAGPAVLGADTTPPNTITTQQLSQPDGTYNVKVTWNDPGDNVNVVNYKLYREQGVSSITNVSQATLLTTIPDSYLSPTGSGTGDPLYSYTDTALPQTTAGTQYAYAVIAFDAAGNASATPTGQTLNILIQDPAPAPVTTLTAVPVSATVNAKLTWSAPASIGGITSYNIYRKAGSAFTQSDLGGVGSANYVGSVSGTTTTYTDTVPTAGTNYYYAVTALNANATSTYSESLLGNSAGPINIPAPPTAVTTSLAANSLVTVGWTASVVTPASYKIYRQLNSGSWTYVAPVTSPTVMDTINMTGQQPGNYNFAVSAVYTTYEGVSNYETVISVPSATLNIVDTEPPVTVTPHVYLSPTNTSHAFINWTSPYDQNWNSGSICSGTASPCNASGVSCYWIYGSYNGGAIGIINSTGACYQPTGYNQPGTALSYTDTNTLTPGGFAQYEVESYDNAGNNSTSAPITVYAIPASISLTASNSATTSANVLTWGPPISGNGIASYSIYAKAESTPAAMTATDLTPANLIGSIQASGSNLALNKTATSGYYTNSYAVTPASNAVDGNLSTFWQGGQINWDCAYPYVWLEVDLGSVQSIGAVAWSTPTSQSTGLPNNYVIETSTDGSTWTQRVSVTGNTAYTNSYAFAPVSARYVRMDISAAGGGGSCGGQEPVIGEFQVYAVPYTFVHNAQNSVLPAQVGQTYAYAVTATDTKGYTSGISTCTPVALAVIDKDPPVKTGFLNLSTAVGSDAVKLSWPTPYDNVGATQYQIYRMPISITNTPGPVTDSNYTTATLLYTGTYASSVPGTQNTYLDSTWYPGYDVYYAVRSSDAAGNWSPISNSPNILVGQDTSAPKPPMITHVSATTSEVDVRWDLTTDIDDTPGNSTVATYALYRADASQSPFTNGTGITPNNFSQTTLVCNQIPGNASQVTVWADNGQSPNVSPAPSQGHTYYYALRAKDTAGNWSAPFVNLSTTTLPAEVTVPTTAVVNTAPTWPSNALTATAVQFPDIDLVWTPAVDNGTGQAGLIDHYSVYRSTSNFNNLSTVAQLSAAGITPIGTVAGTENSFIDDTGYTGTTYYYGVIAVDDASPTPYVSRLSNVTSATVAPPPCPDINPPTLPGNFAAATGNYPYVNLTWVASTDLETCSGQQVYQPIGFYKLYYAASTITIPDNADTMSDSTLNASGIYTMIIDGTATTYAFRGTGGSSLNFRLEAYDAAGNKSGLCVQVTGQVAPAPCSTTTPPSVPGNLSATIGPAPDMAFTWTASTVGGCASGTTGCSTCNNLIDHYNLYRSPCTSFDASGNGVPSITTSTDLSTITPIRIAGDVTNYIDTSGLPNTWYSYVMTAVDSLGNRSGMSAIITKQTEQNTIPPAAINNLKASAMTGGGIQLYWCKSSSPVGINHYDIYRVQQSTIMTDSQIVQANYIGSSYNTGGCVTWNDGGANNNDTSSLGTPASGTTYSYAVIAVDNTQPTGLKSTISYGANSGDTICTAP